MRAPALGTLLRPRRPSAVFVAAALGLVVAVTGVGVAGAARVGVTAVDSRRVTFTGTTVASATNENVEVAGTLHVVTALRGSDEAGWTLSWSTNVDNTVGTGQTTADRYRGTGTDGGYFVLPAGPPVRTVTFSASFRLSPLGPPTHPPSPIRLTVDLVLDESGRLGNVGAHLDPGAIGPAD